MPTRKIVPIFFLVSGFCTGLQAQTVTQTNTLRQAAAERAKKDNELAIRLQQVASEKKWPLSFKNKFGETVRLTGIDAQGYPLYTSTESNLVAANTIGTSRLWNGGGLGLSLSGSSANLKGKLGVWDGGRARATHVELNGRINNKNNVAISDHTTHVSGTLIASGVNPQAKGMAFGSQELVVYDFTNNINEMQLESSNGMLVSNHSYGTISGWYYNSAQSRWEFRGQWNTNEDYKFGYYNDEARDWDDMAYNAPFHLIVKSAGNNRNQNGPAVGQNYWRYNSSNVMIDAGNRPAGIYGNDGYDILPTSATAKNILTVGAINPIPSGYNSPADAVLSDFSSWGPTDDGRIKPDVVADGVNLFSSIGTTDVAYATYSGTSMASPTAAGSLMLLQEHYSQLHSGTFMRSATLKALVIHTADEAGPAAGPDYQYGWGVINMGNAARLISGANSGNKFLIQEKTLNTGQTESFDVVASGTGELKITICWTDPKGAVGASEIDNDARKLINDLDIRITKGATTYLPWILNPASPSSSATRGDNVLDNVEQIVVPNVEPGATYHVTIVGKGTLSSGSQAYSIIASGVGGAAYCNNSAPTILNGARIDSVAFGGIQKLNAPGCAGYNNFTSITGSVEPNSTIPIYVRVNSCTPGTVDKVVKVWLDINNDGDFADAGELLGTSPVINDATGVYAANVSIPGGLTAGNYGILRIIVQETSNPNDVAPCGAYSKGETQDYRVRFQPPSNDVAVTAVVAPASPACADDQQYVTIRFRNLSTSNKSNIALSGTVKDGATVVVNLSGAFTPAVAASGEVLYTFQTPFNAVAGKTYTITAKATLTGDQNTANDELSTSVTISAAPANPIAAAEVCNNTSVILQASNAGPDVILWYESATATNPIAVGSTAFTNVVRADKTYYVGRNDLDGKVGPTDKNTLGVGGYNSPNGTFMKFNTTVPLTIERFKLYVGSAGKVTFTVADFVEWVGTGGSYRYTPISSITLNVDATNVGGVDNGAVYVVNLSVPDPGDHILIAQVTDGATLYRNNGLTTNPNQYPFSIPNIFSFTGNSQSGSTNSDQYKSFYYYFYDTKVSLNGCASGRVPVVATVPTAPVITLNGSRFSSSIATGNQWYKDGIEIPGATGQTYDATETGLYKSIVTSPLGCGMASNEIQFGVTGVPNIDPAEIGLKVMPNPNDGRFTLDFSVTRKADLDITIVNAIGQKVYQNHTPGFIGRYTKAVDMGRLAPGVYLLQVQHDNKSYMKKMFVR